MELWGFLGGSSGGKIAGEKGGRWKVTATVDHEGSRELGGCGEEELRKAGRITEFCVLAGWEL